MLLLHQCISKLSLSPSPSPLLPTNAARRCDPEELILRANDKFSRSNQRVEVEHADDPNQSLYSTAHVYTRLNRNYVGAPISSLHSTAHVFCTARFTPIENSLRRQRLNFNESHPRAVTCAFYLIQA